MIKKWGIAIAALLCCILSTVSIWADDGKNQNPDYATDYYMIVQSSEGGINLYSEADPESSVLNDKLIVNGTAIHIEGEKTGADQKEWGYTQYHGMNGYVPMDDLDPATRAEAVRREYSAFGGTDADFDVKIQAEDGNAPLYNGPGEKFEEVSGFDGIEDSSTVHISQYVKGEDGIDWGKTVTDGTEGWINLDRDTDYQSEDAQPEDSADKESTADQNVAMGESATATEITSTTETTPTVKATTPTPKAAPAKKATPTPKATPTEKATPTPKATPTEKATPTPEATPTDEASAEDAEKEETKSETSQEQAETEKKEEAEKKDNTDRKDSDSEKSQKTSGKNVKTSSGMKTPVVWISLIGILAIIILLIYFLRKKK